MLQVLILPSAKADINRIWHRTVRRWDETQAFKYLDKIHVRIERLSVLPNIGKTIGDAEKGYRSLRAEEHLIIYRILGETVEVARILHKKMNLPRHLP